MPQLSIVALSFGLALLVAAVSTPLVIKGAWRLLALDVPGTRKVHLLPVPRLGGIAVMAGFVVGVAVPLGVMGYEGTLVGPLRYHWIGWIGAIALLFVCGLIDDLRGLGPLSKLLVQLVAAVGVYGAGFRIDFVSLPLLGPIDLGALALPLTILWVVGVTNAINLIDGLDGLATGIGFLMTATLGAISYYKGVFPVTVISFALAGSLLGFLPYNFNPARIFLGDSGSQFLGFTLAVISIRGMQKSATVVALLVPLLALGLPLLDTLLVLLRRTWRTQVLEGGSGLRDRLARSRGLFQGDQEHIHHNLLELGFSHRKAVLLLYIVAGAFCAAAFGLVALRDPTLAILLGVSATIAMAILKLLAVHRRTYAPPQVVATVPVSGLSSGGAPHGAAASSAVSKAEVLHGDEKC